MKNSHHLIKRLADVLLVVLTLPLTIPVIIIVALAVRLSSGPGVFFFQERAGEKARPFQLIKFRTMRKDVDPFGASPKDGADSRLTGVGKILRLLSLDELPQLANVLAGDMSLVGPRPLYVAQIAEWNQRQKRRLEVKPGLTGLAQISGRGSLTIEAKLELDVNYVENQSLLLDTRILLGTVFRMLRPTDIYEKQYSENQETRQKK